MTPAMPETAELLTTPQAAAFLNRPAATLRQWRYRGYGPQGFRVGGIVMYRRTELERFLQHCETAHAVGRVHA